jgi:hypothetical protein
MKEEMQKRRRLIMRMIEQYPELVNDSVDISERIALCSDLMYAHMNMLANNWCKKHPSYHGVRKTRVDCQQCFNIRQLRLELEELEQLYAAMIVSVVEGKQ